MAIKNERPPYAQNPFGSRILFREREYYKQNWLTPSEASNLIDFWNDKEMEKYGLVNLKNQTIRLNDSFLRTLPTEPEHSDNHAVNFVVDAFIDLKKYMDNAGNAAKYAPAFGPSSRYYNFHVNTQNSWEPLEQSYHRHMTNVFDPFTEKYLQVPEYKKRVRTIYDFMKMFLQSARDVGRTVPLSKTGFAENIYAGPKNFNGLIIEIGPDPNKKNDHSMDFEKTYWINDHGFKYWLRACRLHGFLVDRNAPWRIVPNLSSKKMREYMAKYKIYSLQQLFDTMYVPVHMDDIKNMKDYIFKFWKAFMRFEPEVEVPHYSFSHQSTSVDFQRRVDITRSSFDNSYGDIFWMKYWFELRCYELELNVPDSEKRRIFKTAAKIKKELDIHAASDYIVSILLKRSGQSHPPERSFIHRETHRQILRKS